MAVISLLELNKGGHPIDDIINDNLRVLCYRLNLIEVQWGKTMIITSGLRSDIEQRELIRLGKSGAVRSKHLTGQAADVLDRDGELKLWLKERPELLMGADLWCEDCTIGWVHFQTVAPKSGRRWFLP